MRSITIFPLSLTMLQLSVLAFRLQSIVARPPGHPFKKPATGRDRNTPVLRMYSVAHPLSSSASDKSNKFDFNLDMSDFQFAPNDQTDFSFAFDHNGADNSQKSSKSFDEEELNEPQEPAREKNNHVFTRSQSYSIPEDNSEDSTDSSFKPLVEKNNKEEPKKPSELDFNDDFFADKKKPRKTGFSSVSTRPESSSVQQSFGVKTRNNRKSDYDVTLEVDDPESEAIRPTFTIEGGDDRSKMREDYNHEPEPAKPKLRSQSKRAKSSKFNSRKPDTDSTYQDK